MEAGATRSTVTLEGVVGLNDAIPLQQLLVEAMQRGTEVHVDAEGAGQLDVTAMQLLLAAGREAERRGVAMSVRLSAAAAGMVRGAGFTRFPGVAPLE